MKKTSDYDDDGWEAGTYNVKKKIFSFISFFSIILYVKGYSKFVPGAWFVL